MKRNAEIRTKLYEQLEEIALGEEMTVDELIDHILRSYVESWPFDEDDSDDEDEDQ